MVIVILLVALGVAGACAGSLFARRWEGLHRLTSLTAGLFFGLAIVLVFPEALHSTSWKIVLLFSVTGCVLFAWIENRLHESMHQVEDRHDSSSKWAILFSIIALHNMMDGWNIGVATQVAERGFAAAFSLGMGVHKLVGGFAVGAMLRRPGTKPTSNLILAATAEGVTILGVGFEHFLLPNLGQAWTGWLLAATGGSFLFLAFHIFAEAHRAAGFRKTASYAVLGFVIIGVAAIAEHY